MLVYSLTNVEDVDTTGEDHAYDETRYFIMERPISAKEQIVKERKPYDPLS